MTAVEYKRTVIYRRRIINTLRTPENMVKDADEIVRT